MPDDDDPDLPTVVEKMLKNGVSGQKHHQPQTIAGWFASHEQGEVKDLLDDAVSDRSAPIRRKGRGTVQLTSASDAKRYLKNRGRDPRDDDWK